MIIRMQQRRDTAANWTAANPVLAAGEIGYDTTNKLFKVGDGVTHWSALSSDLESLAALTPTAGQVPIWDATLGRLTYSNPSGNSMNAAATNVSNLVTTATGAISPATGPGAPVLIPGTAISVTNSGGRSVKLEFEAGIQQSAAGTGQVWVAVAETTAGVVYKRYNIKPLPGSITTNLNRTSMGVCTFDLGAVTTTRTFALYIVVLSATGTPAVAVVNQATDPTILRAINL